MPFPPLQNLQAHAIAVQSCRFQGQGLELAADMAGPIDGYPVLLLHGGGQTRHAWSKALHDLGQAGYRAISLDLRGHGESAWAPDGDYSLDVLVADLQAVIATLPYPPVLVGASLGGVTSILTIAASLDAGRAVPARAVVLVDVALHIEQAGAEEIRSFMLRHMDGFDSLEQVMDAVTAFNPHRAPPRNSAGLMHNLRKAEDGRLYWHWDPNFLRQRPVSSLVDMNARMAGAASRIQVPVLLVRGQQSKIVSQESIDDLKARIPQARVVDIAGAGHMVVGDKNDAFNTAVLSFLNQELGS